MRATAYGTTGSVAAACLRAERVRWMRRAALLACALPAATPSAARAQTPTTPPHVAEPVRPDDRLARAKELFERGIALYDAGDPEGALDVFNGSREILPGKGNTANAALCLNALGRYDEALELYEELLARFASELRPADRATIVPTISALRAKVGNLIVSSNVDGTLVIDGRPRSRLPLATPVRVLPGARLVRVLKDGYATFEATIDVAAGATTAFDAKLVPLAVAAPTGREQPPAADPPRLTIALLEPEPLPVAIEWNGVEVPSDQLGRALEADPGPHVIVVKWPDGSRSTERLTLASGDRRIVRVAPVRDPEREGRRAGFEMDLTLGPAFARTLGGDAASSCQAGCSSSVGFGVLAAGEVAYRFRNGIALGATVGYLAVSQSLTDRPAELLPVAGYPANPGRANDELLLRGSLLGASATLAIGEAFPFYARLGGGVLVGEARDEREGSFSTTDRADPENPGQTIPAKAYVTGPLRETHGTMYAYFAPDLRMGIRLTPRLDATLGATLLILVRTSRAEWSDATKVDTGSDGLATFGAATLAGDSPIVFLPSLGLRYRVGS